MASSLSGAPHVSAIVLAYGEEPILEECVGALLSSEGVQVEVVLVDNGCSSPLIERLRQDEDVLLLRPGRNTGFAGGCNLGAEAASSDRYVFINSDAVVRPAAIAALVRTLDDPNVGLASGSLRLYDRPDVINSSGNPIHYLGLSWAGGLGEPATLHSERHEIAGATGAALACTRATWVSLGGFCEDMFAYCEDADLSLRCWQSQRSVVYVPDAVVLHQYEFSRNPNKLYLMERNRLLMLLTVYEARTLLYVMPALVGLEMSVLALAISQGWGRQKVAGWWWLLAHWRLVTARRRAVQKARKVPDRDIVDRLTASFDPGDGVGFRAPRPLIWVSRFYWRVIRSLLH